MANPTSRNELIDYCLRRLGAPVIEINVDDDQLEDRLDEALQFYQTYHSDAIIKTYVKHQITAFDVANGYIDLDNKYTYVRRILPLGDENSSINMFDARYQMSLNDVYNLRGGSLSGIDSYYQTQQYVSTLSLLLDGTPAVRFSRHQDRLHIDVDWGEDIKEGDYVIIDADAIIDPGSFSDVFNDMWLKRYVTALIKEQWGQNISKFEGMQLPGGVIMNGRAILEDARAEIESLEEEIRMNFEMPVDFYCG